MNCSNGVERFQRRRKGFWKRDIQRYNPKRSFFVTTLETFCLLGLFGNKRLPLVSVCLLVYSQKWPDKVSRVPLMDEPTTCVSVNHSQSVSWQSCRRQRFCQWPSKTDSRDQRKDFKNDLMNDKSQSKGLERRVSRRL